ncbi:MAG: HAMP domain-containing sensor histidine kinase [Chloroflexota bacterium]
MSPAVRRQSLRARLALIYTGLLAAALVAFGAGTYLVLRSELQRSFDDGLRADAEHVAGVLAQQVTDEGSLKVDKALVDLFASTGGRVAVLDANGRLIADSAAPGVTPLPFTTQDLALGATHTHAIREDAVDGDTIHLTVEPVLAPDGHLAGYAIWTQSTAPLRGPLGTVGASLIVGGIIVVLLALAAGLVLAKKALAPVADITDAARAIALSGDFGARVEAGSSGDEIADLEIAFNEMLAALEQNHLALQRFLGDASHQLRTPLTTIRANLDLLRRPGLADDERREIVSDARDEAERMGRLIGDLLSLARAESGDRLRFEPVEIDALLIGAVRHHRQAAPHVRMTLGRVEPAVVDGDHDRLVELVGILLDNAARYTPEGGAVATSLEVDGAQVIIRVADTGIGLDDEDREHAFERLYRGTRARELRPAGTGLGLAIARWIAEAHGGSIALLDRDGGGAVATVTLPRRG